jgi:FAD dependent oxidoreductase
VAVGCYAEYDRHDAFFPTYVETTRYARVPMETLMAEGHPDLLVSTAISTDYRAYSSAVRMEHTRAHMGGAAGAVIVIADRLRIAPDQVPYQEVRRLLLGRGYRLDIG